ncbi:MAG TPA: hypothetical protein VD794_04375 [Flavisolibacter sp.]|nr:hypothetical protein [Flavisolibacter sp.]
MTTTKLIDTTWHADEKLIITNISGNVDQDDIEYWDQSLQQTLAQLEDNSTFKIFVNLHGFKANNFNAHKRFRTVVPTTLANYGWRVGYLALFEEANNLDITQTRGIRCTAAVHVHQDETKIDLYEKSFGGEREHFFTDPVKAEQWIRSIEA